MRCGTKQNNSCSVDNTLANLFTPYTLNPVSVGVIGVDNCTQNAFFIKCAQGEIMEKNLKSNAYPLDKDRTKIETTGLLNIC